jgi:hypothetical protein
MALMGIIAWWSERTKRAPQEAQCDENAIARLAPELSGMALVEGASHVRHKLEVFQESCTPAQAKILTSRLLASRQIWEAQGLAMPYWGTLVVLRTLQAEIAAQSVTLAPPPDMRPDDVTGLGSRRGAPLFQRETRSSPQ